MTDKEFTWVEIGMAMEEMSSKGWDVTLMYNSGKRPYWLFDVATGEIGEEYSDFGYEGSDVFDVVKRTYEEWLKRPTHTQQ